MTLPTLNIIGTGRLGMTLGRLLADHNLVRIGSLFNRTPQKAKAAREFIGQGTPCSDPAEAMGAEIWLLSVSDSAIESMSETLAGTHITWQGATVFHCSGIHSSDRLSALAARGAATASIHPVHSFASPASSLHSFPGTFCTMEGSPQALNTLAPLLSELGARLTTVEASAKPLYHAATAVASNHIVALIASSLEMLEKSGMTPNEATELLAPLLHNSVQNALTVGPERALTGPISRGDSGTVKLHLCALDQNTPQLKESYLSLARQTLALAMKNPASTNPGHREIARLLDTHPPKAS